MDSTDAAVGYCPHRGCRQPLVHLVYAEDSESYWLDVVVDGASEPAMLHWPDAVDDPIAVSCRAHVPPAPCLVTHRDIQDALVHWLWARRTQRITVRPAR